MTTHAEGRAVSVAFKCQALHPPNAGGLLRTEPPPKVKTNIGVSGGQERLLDLGVASAPI